ncbi:MAG TPA: hypothetical protein PK307_12700 [Spirochaetota bacterium]|nr:hypothetical protein [Spirochaetota bacterium]HOD15115.1 hypothetical protein [Spirochaetota bacterium]HPG51690.1 hypothetical protein [Spirochaetota bacterium]HPN12862.1 hypothetical protein [Spirochaetota bacterium]HQL83058.1 hypothetical protein [Spirochaetota bacterium]
MAESQDILVQKKLALLKAGLAGFIGCLVLSFFSIVLQVVVSLWQLIPGVENTGAWLSSLGLAFLPLFFAGAFVFFGLIIAAAVKEPRNADMGALLKPSAGTIASYFIVGVLLNVAPLLATLAAFLGLLYYRGGSILFLALGYFVISCLLFFASAGFAIVRSAHREAGSGPEAPVMKVLLGALRPEALGDRSRRVLTRIERFLGSGLGIVLYLLFTSRDLYEAVRSKTGHGSDTTWFDLLASTDAVLAFFSLFIFIFSTLFVIISIKTAFDVKPDTAGPDGPAQDA